MTSLLALPRTSYSASLALADFETSFFTQTLLSAGLSRDTPYKAPSGGQNIGAVLLSCI